MGETKKHTLKIKALYAPGTLLLLQCSHRVGGSKTQQLGYARYSSNTQLHTERK